MTLVDGLGIYGAVVATAVVVWDVIKWRRGRACIRLSCYLGKIVDGKVIPSGARLGQRTPESDAYDRTNPRFVVYNIRNTGGTLMTINNLGSKHKDGNLFYVCGGSPVLPQTIPPGDSLIQLVPPDTALDSVRRFFVTDGVGRMWWCRARTFQKQLVKHKQSL